MLKINKVITIKAAKDAKVTLNVLRSTSFEIVDNGSLQLDGLIIDAKKAADSAGNVLVSTSRIPMLTNYRFELRNSAVTNFNINHSFHFFDAGFRSFADEIVIDNSKFSHVTGDILRLHKENDDLGIYNAEYVTITNSQFFNIAGALVKLYRGGTDESTFGPHLLIKNNRLENVGLGSRNKEKSVVLIHGAQVTNVASNQFINTAVIDVNHTVGEPITTMNDNRFVNTPEITVEELNFPGQHTVILSNNTYETAEKNTNNKAKTNAKE